MLGVVLGEGVLVHANWAQPGFESVVDLAVGVQHSLALFAKNGLILDQGQVLNVFHGCVHAADGCDNSCGADLVAGPEVPAKADSVSLLSLVEVHI